MMDEVLSAGPLDILVNNAGIQHTAPLADMPRARWDAILAINLSAAFDTMRLALPGMMARGYGRIVNIASVHGLVASVQKAPYVAAKFGLVGLTRVAALEAAQAGNRGSGGVTANCICPGWTETAIIEPQIQARAARVRRRPRGRHPRSAAREAAERPHVDAGRDRADGAVAVRPGSAQPDRRGHSDRRRLDGPVDAARLRSQSAESHRSVKSIGAVGCAASTAIARLLSRASSGSTTVARRSSTATSASEASPPRRCRASILRRSRGSEPRQSRMVKGADDAAASAANPARSPRFRKAASTIVGQPPSSEARAAASRRS